MTADRLKTGHLFEEISGIRTTFGLCLKRDTDLIKRPLRQSKAYAVVGLRVSVHYLNLSQVLSTEEHLLLQAVLLWMDDWLVVIVVAVVVVIVQTDRIEEKSHYLWAAESESMRETE